MWHVDRLADRAGEERLHRSHHPDMTHIVDAATANIQRAVKHLLMLLFQAGGSGHIVVLIHIVNDLLGLLLRIAQLS
ncbi:hypothetical protein BMS3Bbin04_02119 [bacterium BMS3Bbin04]|nr:hypothetical protein BMS3Bbin04_02119 [bacterium BMS3Bbin04]